MPYAILTSQAKLVNTYVCGPIVVGDKGADPKLMKAVGAKLVTNYPACGSPPIYLMYGSPRVVLEKFEESGYFLQEMSVAGDCRECLIWTLFSESGYEDPNNKAIQTESEEELNEKRCSKESRGSKTSRGSQSSKKSTSSTDESKKRKNSTSKTDSFKEEEGEIEPEAMEDDPEENG